MLTAPLSAASKLRELVLKVPGTVLLSQAGHPDEIIRLEVIPEYLNAFKKRNEAYIWINLDRGPDQEHWRAAIAEVNRSARRDRPVPNPIPVAEDSHKEWSISPEDVPVIENGVRLVAQPQPLAQEVPLKAQEILKCSFEGCGLTWDSKRALSAHERFAHKK